MKMRDVPVGKTFVAMGEEFTKQNELGEAFMFCNCKDSNGDWVHIDTDTEIESIKEK